MKANNNAIKNNLESTLIKKTKSLHVNDGLSKMKLFDILTSFEKEDWEIWYKKRDKILTKNIEFKERTSPFLLSQITYIQNKCFKQKVDVNAGIIIDTIRKIEGKKNYPPSLDISKHSKTPFKGKVLNSYEHTHVPILPSCYINTFADKPINQERIAKRIQGKNEFDIGDVHNEIILSNRGNMTGDWLISKIIDNKTYYLAFTTHGTRKEGGDE